MDIPIVCHKDLAKTSTLLDETASFHDNDRKRSQKWRIKYSVKILVWLSVRIDSIRNFNFPPVTLVFQDN